jgi:PPIC-type PPIASE domain
LSIHYFASVVNSRRLVHIGRPHTMIASVDLTSLILPNVQPVTEQEAIDALKYSLNYADVAAFAERDNLVVKLCQQLNISVSEGEVQEEGDIFRRNNALRDSSETLQWLSTQRITAENWAKGIHISMLTDKLKEHICGSSADSYYISNRRTCRRVALSQILVGDLATAVKISRQVRENQSLFCSLALEHSKGRQSAENGGFAGVKLVAELLPEIAQAIEDAGEGDVLDPVQSKLGYHVLRVEKWFPAELSQVRQQLLDYLFQSWLNELKDS